MASSSENVVPSPDSSKRDLDAFDFSGTKAMVDFDLSEELRSTVPAAWSHVRNSKFSNTMCQALSSPAVGDMFHRLRNHILQNPQASLQCLGKPGALQQVSVPVVQMITNPEIEPILAELDGHGPAALSKFWDDNHVLKMLGKSLLLAEGLNYDDEEDLVSEGRKALKIACGGFQTDQMMSSSSEKTLPCPDSSEITSPAPAPKLDALDFPGMKAMEDYDSCIRELGEKKFEDPAYIQLTEELSRSSPAEWVNFNLDQEQLSNIMPMFQRLQNNVRQNPRASLENLGKPGALEEFSERVAQMKKDPEVETILSELYTRGPLALLEFGEDKQVLKKLGKSMLVAQGLNCDDDDEELVSEGRKALKIASGYARMKCVQVILDSQRKKANKVERKKKTTSHHAAESGKTKRSSLLPNKGDAV